MKVTVIIPIYNVEAYIERCLLSVLTQTWDELEMILVNDCTPDNSMAVVEKVLRKSARRNIVRIFQHKQNKGLSGARNTGVQAATGDYVYFLDSDDYLPINAIELLATEAQKYRVDFVMGNYTLKGSNRWSPPMKLASGILKNNETILKTLARDEWYVMAPNKLVNRSFLLKESISFMNGIVHEDDLWSFQLACRAGKAYVVNEITYYYCIREGSITTNPSQRNLDCRLIVIKAMYDFVCKNLSLQQNPWIYILFEQNKAKYMDRILFFSKEKSFYHKAYQLFRETSYLDAFTAMRQFPLPCDLMGRNIHYFLPPKLGYFYFKGFVQIAYKWLLLKMKLGLKR